MSSARKLIIFTLLIVACCVGTAVAVVSGIRSNDTDGTVSAAARQALPAARAADRPVVVFRSLDARSAKAGQLAVSSLGDTPEARAREPLGCERVYFAAGRGLCLARATGFAAGYRVRMFDSDLRVRHDVDVAGIPSRARVSPDGRFGSVTFFVAGHAYATAGAFSTQTTLFDLATGERIADLEDFTVTRGGRQVTAVDVNYWGVTFADDGDTFYATLATGGKTYLIRGSISGRTARAIHENVECPSLSPDGTRIAFKKRVGKGASWRLTVLDLATMRETPLSETRSVDDQAEWLDDDHVLYGLDKSVWTVTADGRGKPRRFIAAGDSPAVVRW